MGRSGEVLSAGGVVWGLASDELADLATVADGEDVAVDFGGGFELRDVGERYVLIDVAVFELDVSSLPGGGVEGEDTSIADADGVAGDLGGEPEAFAGGGMDVA